MSTVVYSLFFLQKLHNETVISLGRKRNIKVTCVMRWALAIVSVNPIHTHTAIQTVVAWTVVDVMLTMLTCEA